MDLETVLEWSDRYLFRTYRRAPVAFVRGQGVRLWDLRGREYLDFVAGIATSSLGHAHPDLVRTLCDQASRYLHVSNLYHIPEQARAAKRLAELSGLDRVFFCNSGAEAVEAAIKLARRWGRGVRGPDVYEIVAMEGSFHGRTLGALAATGTPRYWQGFEPLPPGFRFVPYDDLGAVADAITERTCAVLVEPVQGEGGVVTPSPGYLRDLEALCRERGVLLVLDEVQTGIGRTGAMFAFQREGVQPDVVTLGKGLAGGVPVGAVLAREDVAGHLGPGDHGSTFGGNPLACAAVCTVLEVVERDGLLENARRTGDRLLQGLRALAERDPRIESVRGVGLLVATDLRVEAAQVVEAALGEGLLVNAVRPHTLRLCPPLVVSEAEVDEAVARLGRALGKVQAR
jgi:acetylornithine aminotransferase/acetylornithine/N-succinyldiaminopimelate aminotransferase